MLVIKQLVERQILRYQAGPGHLVRGSLAGLVGYSPIYQRSLRHELQSSDHVLILSRDLRHNKGHDPHESTYTR